MGVQERLRLIKLAELIDSHKEEANKMGIEIEFVDTTSERYSKTLKDINESK